MYDQRTAHDWPQEPSTGNDGARALPFPMDVSTVDEEEMPKPFLNEYLPTQAEIQRVCQEIQKDWTDSERRRRQGYRRGRRRPHNLRIVRTAISG